MRHTKHYVELLYPGLLFPETDIQPVEARNPALFKDDELKTRYGNGKPYGFRFFDRTFIWATDDEGARFEREVEGPHNWSAYYYPEAEVFSRAQAEKMDVGGNLITNMNLNGYERVVRTRRGNWQPFIEGETVVL